VILDASATVRSDLTCRDVRRSLPPAARAAAHNEHEARQMIDLYWKPETVADVVVMALRLAGAEHRILAVGTDVTEDEYLAINPAGTLPAMVDGDLVLFETIAILMYVADHHPGAQLAPAPGTPQHALYDRWLAYVSANLMAAYYRWYHVADMIDGDDHQEALKRGAERDVNAIGRRIESELGEREWLLGDGPAMPDLLLGNVATWGDDIDGVEPLGPRLAGLVARVAAL
jgi:glutathione S-transferase